MKSTRLLFVSLLLCLMPSAATQAADGPRRYECPRASGAIQIDGKLEEAAWQGAPWTDWFVDIQGASRPSPRFKTRAKMLWDDDFLYIGADMEEPDVWATLTKHDSVIFHDNDFEVFLNPTADGLKYFEFEINALNTGWDLFLPKRYLDGGKADNAWEIPGLRTAVHVRGTLNDPKDRDQGWSVEVAFPWTAFQERSGKGRPSPGDEWRVNFSRVEWRTHVESGKYVKDPGREDNWVWSPQGLINMHVPALWGYLKFTAK